MNITGILSTLAPPRLRTHRRWARPVVDLSQPVPASGQARIDFKREQRAAFWSAFLAARPAAVQVEDPEEYYPEDNNCASGGCYEREDCGCYGEDFDCMICGGSGERIPEHCCDCGGNVYQCTCCGTCGSQNIGTCGCQLSILTADGGTRTV